MRKKKERYIIRCGDKRLLSLTGAGGIDWARHTARCYRGFFQDPAIELVDAITGELIPYD